jgi:hypothetical protein
MSATKRRPSPAAAEPCPQRFAVLGAVSFERQQEGGLVERLDECELASGGGDALVDRRDARVDGRGRGDRGSAQEIGQLQPA